MGHIHIIYTGNVCMFGTKARLFSRKGILLLSIAAFKLISL
uniref:Uncharacterized protein n=1 Tax=Arundo donax TaxID=35708 RepID=A0A0A9VWD5_ARUDO